eukprot:649064_1
MSYVVPTVASNVSTYASNAMNHATEFAAYYMSQYEHDWTPVPIHDEEPGSVANPATDDDDEDEKNIAQNDYHEINCKDNANRPNHHQKCAVLVIGITGTGKSSIVGLLSGHGTKVSSGSQRGTDTTSMFQSKYDKNLYFIDTVGLQDSNIGFINWADPKLLKKTLQYVHHMGVHKIKIILCVSGDTGTRMGPFTQMTHFIGGMQLHEEGLEDINVCQSNSSNSTDEFEMIEANIWNSVLIIKKGTPGTIGIDPEGIDDMKGVISAARQGGATESFEDKRHIFGFTCTDWMDNQKYQSIMKVLKPDQYEENGYFTKQNAKTIITKKLNALPSFELVFQKEQCTKCGAKGDPRYIIAPCHTKDEYFHIKPPERYHSGQQTQKHTSILTDHQIHSGWMHTGQRKSIHNGHVSRYHPGNIRETSVARTMACIFTLGWSELVTWQGTAWHWYDCCNEYIGTATPCARRWSCCNAPPGRQFCANTGTHWTCCNKGGVSQGCTETTATKKRYMCCNQAEGSSGCEMVWNCCGQYKGCKKPGNYDGCKVDYPCCKRELDSMGCTKKCPNCKINWGKGPGCVQTKD